MRKSYDFAKSGPNPYIRKVTRPVTIRLDQQTIDYFKALAVDTGMPYQKLINIYLRECAMKKKRLRMKWTP